MNPIEPKSGTTRQLDVDSIPNISIERLEKNIIELGLIGRNESDHGVYRTGFTPKDFEARHWLMNKIKEIGLESYIDGAGNVFGKNARAGTQESFFIGSHLDSVPRGGVLDGALGVLAALECLQVIEENNIELAQNLELVATSDEEGRFGGMIGAEAICGEISLERLKTARDTDGISLESAINDCGLSILDVLKARRNPDFMSGFLELHIEQGPVLDSKNYDIGVVESISGIFHWTVRLIGEANHSGTTPMSMRRDAFQGLCEFSGEIPRILEENGTDDARATIGKINLIPPNPHTIPGEVEFSLVGRDFNEEAMLEIENACRKVLSAIGRRRGLMMEYKELSRIPPTLCDPTLSQVIEDEAKKLKVKHLRMPSGAGHDAQIFGRYMPSAMIFIPSYKGISHSPDEWSSLEHIEMGANMLLRSTLSILKKK